MENRIRTMSCNLSNRYLKTAFNELRSTIADHQAPSWVQLYFLVELCRKTIEELKINPPILKDYYSCSIVNTTGPKDFLICTLEVIEEAFECECRWLPHIVMEWEEQELFSTALQIIGKYLGLISHREIAIVNRSDQCYRLGRYSYSYPTYFDQLRQIGSNLVQIGSFVRSENLYSSLDILSSVINELEAEYRHLSCFLDWFRSFIEDESWLRYCKKSFRLLANGALAAESNSVRLAKGLTECGAKIKRLANELLAFGCERKPFPKEDPKNLKITDDLCGYLDGLKYAIRQLKEQLSEKEEVKKGAERRRRDELDRWVEEFIDANFKDTEPILLGQPEICLKSELPEHPDKENRQ